MVKALSAILPDAGFIAEENPQLKISNELNWIVDPLDKFVMVYILDKSGNYGRAVVYSNEDKIKSNVLDELEIDLSKVFI